MKYQAWLIAVSPNTTDGEDDNDVQHLPGNKEEDKEEHEGHGDEVICLEIMSSWAPVGSLVSTDLIVQEVTHHLAGHLLRIVQLWKLKPEHNKIISSKNISRVLISYFDSAVKNSSMLLKGAISMPSNMMESC